MIGEMNLDWFDMLYFLVVFIFVWLVSYMYGYRKGWRNGAAYEHLMSDIDAKRKDEES